MLYYKDLLKNYEITTQDTKNISRISSFMLEQKQEFIDNFFEYLLSKYKSTSKLEGEVMRSFKKEMEKWYSLFFKGEFSTTHIKYLINIGKEHLKFNVPQDQTNALYSFSRQWFHEKISQYIEDHYERKEVLLSMHKLMDINKDLTTKGFYEEKLKKFNMEYNFRNLIVTIGERFSFLIQIILVLILSALTIIATIALANDFFSLFFAHSHDLLITSLGSLLIIWVLAELLRTEIQLIKGADFKISVFIGVALIAYIRDLLIITLQHEKFDTNTYYVMGTILILGILYWLIFRTEKTDPVRRML